MPEGMLERIAQAVREEIVRQYRDDERYKCPAGTGFYEEYVSPGLIAKAAVEAMREPTNGMIEVWVEDWRAEATNDWQAMITAILEGK
jgi:hypothetical protein